MSVTTQRVDESDALWEIVYECGEDSTHEIRDGEYTIEKIEQTCLFYHPRECWDCVDGGFPATLTASYVENVLTGERRGVRRGIDGSINVVRSSE